jgi:hypothetical protein
MVRCIAVSLFHTLLYIGKFTFSSYVSAITPASHIKPNLIHFFKDDSQYKDLVHGIKFRAH